MKGSLIIVGFFILGIAAGLSGMVPESIIDGDLTFYALCALLLCVGIGIGSDRNIVTKFKSLDVRMALLPLGTALGTFAGSLVVSFILSGRSPLDCLAVGSGFGYYSLSSIFITEYKGAELGTIALLANIYVRWSLCSCRLSWSKFSDLSLRFRLEASLPWIQLYLLSWRHQANSIQRSRFSTVSFLIFQFRFW